MGQCCLGLTLAKSNEAMRPGLTLANAPTGQWSYSVAAVALSVTALFGQTRPDFAGQWRRVEGAESVPEVLTITQDEKALTVATAGFPNAVHRLDGAETRSSHRPPLPLDSTVVRSYRSAWDGLKLVTKIAIETTVKRRSSVEFWQETLYLEGESTMVVEMRPFVNLFGAPATLETHPPLALQPNKVDRAVYKRMAPK